MVFIFASMHCLQLAYGLSAELRLHFIGLPNALREIQTCATNMAQIKFEFISESLLAQPSQLSSTQMLGKYGAKQNVTKFLAIDGNQYATRTMYAMYNSVYFD